MAVTVRLEVCLSSQKAQHIFSSICTAAGKGVCLTCPAEHHLWKMTCPQLYSQCQCRSEQSSQCRTSDTSPGGQRTLHIEHIPMFKGIFLFHNDVIHNLNVHLQPRTALRTVSQRQKQQETPSVNTLTRRMGLGL